MGITEPALMCLQEMKVEGSLQKCIRVMVVVEGSYERNGLRHVYLRGASNLRPDLRK
ncbi:chorismate mutase AroH [Clostridiales bacterium]|nr:chorismate mutase AroH [Clostridiales bacterium]